MAKEDYLNFDLLIDSLAEANPPAYRARVVASPAGEARLDFTLPFSADELAAFFVRSGRIYRHLRTTTAAETEVALLTPQGFGERLFDAAFGGGVGRCLLLSLAEAKRQRAGLRIRLRLDEKAAALADLPWEYLYVSDDQTFLALSDDTPIVRYIELLQGEQLLQVTPPLRILAVIADPKNVRELDVEQEWQRLQSAVADLQTRQLLTLERLDVATLAALQARLRKDDVHIIHFIGHGYFDARANTGGLVLEGEDGLRREVTAERLAVLLGNSKSLRLLFLNACEGARSGRDDFFAGVAQTLVRRSILAVIAMQFEVSDQAAITLAHTFYQALVDGYPVDAALSQARKSLYLSGEELEWGTPVLFSRSPDNRILVLPESEPPFGRQQFEPETVPIPAGPFLMGSAEGPGVPAHETPQTLVTLPAYRIGKHPVTNGEYEAFVRATGRLVAPEMGWEGQSPPPDKRNHPLTGVTFYDAVAYCQWLKGETDRAYTLPNEAQWEKAARGTDGRRYPWGDEWEEDRCNLGGETAAPVDAFPAQSIFGCCDLVGNVREWTSTLWGAQLREPDSRFVYPWQEDGRNDLNANEMTRRIWRGCGYRDAQAQARCAARGAQLPRSRGGPNQRYGFRVALVTTS